ncbi:MAG: septal ring lytic transglycosylase RlpA family protein [Candidatus Pacebacteria bacterium]|nr:septal ring lytic transglycosylase RlpA family protein [Candidatus Paceibacterota bacterium]
MKQLMVASYYGGPEDHKFHGKKMANGEDFNENDPTLAAHKSLPFGTEVKLTNPENGQTQKVIIKDYGPHVKGRDIDVSYAAAQKLGFIREGEVTLEAEIIR